MDTNAAKDIKVTILRGIMALGVLKLRPTSDGYC
jgi:hypothetical protein